MTPSIHGTNGDFKEDPPGKAKEKGKKRKGKGRGGRRFFRPRRSKGKGKRRRKGRANMVGEEGYDDEWNDYDDDWYDDEYDGFLADNGSWNDCYWTDELCYKDEHGYFQKKGKEKERKMKAKEETWRWKR